MSEEEEYKKSNEDWYKGLNNCQKTFYMNFIEALIWKELLEQTKEKE